MKAKTHTRLLGCLLVLGGANVGAAEMISYTACTVRSPGAVVAALNTFWEAMSTSEGTNRPTLMLVQNVWNGAASATHGIGVTYADYDAYEDSMARLRANPGPYRALLSSMSAVADCPTEILTIKMKSWGDTDADWQNAAWYPMRINDIRAYIKAFDKLAASETMEDAPVSVTLWEGRAGTQATTYFVNFNAPSFSALNSFLDSLRASEDYAAFADEVASIRTLGGVSQTRKLMMLEP